MCSLFPLCLKLCDKYRLRNFSNPAKPNETKAAHLSGLFGNDVNIVDALVLLNSSLSLVDVNLPWSVHSFTTFCNLNVFNIYNMFGAHAPMESVM